MKKWNEEQIEAYAAAFRDKDAVLLKGYGWDEVAQVYDDEGGYNCVPYSFGTTNVDKHINSWQMRVGRKWIGYPNNFKENCEIVTPKDYEVKEGDKLVWLGKTQKQGKRSVLTFGKSYDVAVSEGGELVYKDDMSISILARTEKRRWEFWGVIPKWENIKEEKVMKNSFKFGVGDKVRVVKGDTLLPNEEVFIGDVGEIAKVYTSGEDQYPYAVDIPEVERYLWVKEDALELVNESTSSE